MGFRLVLSGAGAARVNKIAVRVLNGQNPGFTTEGSHCCSSVQVRTNSGYELWYEDIGLRSMTQHFWGKYPDLYCHTYRLAAGSNANIQHSCLMDRVSADNSFYYQGN